MVGTTPTHGPRRPCVRPAIISNLDAHAKKDVVPVAVTIVRSLPTGGTGLWSSGCDIPFAQVDWCAENP